MQEELQKIEQRNAQKMNILQNLEEKLATMENDRQEKMVENALAKQKNLAFQSSERESNNFQTEDNFSNAVRILYCKHHSRS